MVFNTHYFLYIKGKEKLFSLLSGKIKKQGQSKLSKTVPFLESRYPKVMSFFTTLFLEIKKHMLVLRGLKHGAWFLGTSAYKTHTVEGEG